MKRDWLRFRRMLLDRRSRVLDVLSLAGLAVFAALGPLVFDWPESGPARADQVVLYRWLLWLGLMCIGLLVFGLRRWFELEQAMARADTDVVTRVLSRDRIQRVLETEFGRASRYRRSLSIALVRVDGFAPIAEAQGHMVADRVLFKVAHRMRRRLRTTDYLGRWEGEVFLIVCPETDLPEALSMSTRMRRAIKSQAMGHVGIVTACFGLCTLSGHADGEAMLAEAEGWLTQGLPRSRDRVFSRQDQTAASAGESVQERSSSES